MLDVVEASDSATLMELLPDASVLVTRNGLPPDALRNASRLSWIHVAAAGVDGVLDATLPEHVRITRTSGTFGTRMAEYACAHLLGLAQNVHALRRQQLDSAWRPLPVTHLSGKTAGIAGVGSIGGAMAERLAAFGMKVHGLARSPGAHPSVRRWFTPDEQKEFASELDVLLITLPLTRATHHFVDAEFLGSLKRGAWLLNVGRGAVIDEPALIDALNEGRVGAAVLDVFETEPLPPDSPLWTMSNVVVTPHQAGDALMDEVVDALAHNLEPWRRGDDLADEVDLERSY